MVRDTLGQSVAEGGLWVTLRADATGGVSLGGDASIEPGETRCLPAHLALPLLQSGRAVRAEAPRVAESAASPIAKPEFPKNLDVPPAPAPPPKRGRK